MAKSARLGRTAGATLTSDPIGGSYTAVCSEAGRLFDRIRHSVTEQAAPSTIKSAFLTPIEERLACELTGALCAKTDGDFMMLFNGELTISVV